MDEGTDSGTLLERFAAALSAKGVEFIVIGGQAENLHGSPRVTFDVDLCYRRTKENLERLAEALRGLGVRLRGAPANLPFQVDAASLGLGSNFTFSTDAGDLDLLGYLEPIGGYDEIAPHAELIQLGSLAVRVISLDDLLKIKRHLGRPKDRDALLHLEAIKRMQQEPDRNQD